MNKPDIIMSTSNLLSFFPNDLDLILVNKLFLPPPLDDFYSVTPELSSSSEYRVNRYTLLVFLFGSKVDGTVQYWRPG